MAETQVPTALPVLEGHLSRSPLHFAISLQNKERGLLGGQEMGSLPTPWQASGKQDASSLPIDHSQQPAEGTSSCKGISEERWETPKKDRFPGPSDSSCLGTHCTSPPNQLLSQNCIRPTSAPQIYLPSVYDPHLHQHPTCVLRKGAFY